MGWSIGYDDNWKRDIGYGVPCICDHPDCSKKIDRGLSYVCGSEPYGGEHGCGLYFCEDHRELIDFEDEDVIVSVCEKCKDWENSSELFKPKPDIKEWIKWKLTDSSWNEWRKNNPDKVKEMEEMIND